MENFFVGIFEYFQKHRLVFYTLFASFILLSGYFALQLKFEEDISKVLPRDKKIDKLNEVFQNSKFLDKLVITLSLKDTSITQPDSLVSFAEALAGAIRRQLSPYTTKVSDKVDDGLAMELFGSINDHLPVYLADKDYQLIDSLIEPENIRRTLTQHIRTLTSPAGIALKSMISKDPVGISFIAFRKLQQLQYDENFELYAGYVITRDQKNLLRFITPAFPPNNTGKNALFLNGLDAVIDSLQKQGSNSMEATYFGATAVSVGNALQLRKDTMVTQGITIAFLIFFISVFFKKKRAPFLILVPVVFGALFSLAVIYLIKGSISVIALGTGSIVLGIAVSYSLHVFNHYRHTGNIHEVLRDLSFPLTIGSLTTIGGFLCLQFVESDMLKDLGLFAAFSLVGASLCSLIFLPHFIANKTEEKLKEKAGLSWIDNISAYRPEHNRLVIVIIFVLTGVFAYTSRWVSFEIDMMRMNYLPPKLKMAENKLNTINAFSLQSIYLVSEGETLENALKNNETLATALEKLKDQGMVIKYSGVSSLIVSDSLQLQRIKRWNEYWTADKKRNLLTALEREGAALKFNSSAFVSFRTLVYRNYEKADTNTVSIIRKNFLDDFINEKPEQISVVTLVKALPANKQAIYDTFENNPHITVIDKQYLTGRFVEIINADFTRIALMSSILVFSVLLLTYGRIELTLVSFIPMFITWIWILGIMGIAGIHFNIINIIISALIFGLGDDYSLFIMDGLLQEYKTGRKNLSSYKSSIFLSAITTIAGLGVLIFAKHPALQSIALISIIGILCVVLISQVLIPFLFTILIKNRTRKKMFPWTLTGFLKSAFAFTYFFFGSLLLTVAGWVFIKLNPFRNESSKLIYHKIISNFSRSMMYIMGNVKKTVINLHHEDFSIPAVIICNHQSFLDILVTVMLHPKLVLLTNDWVWKSPVFGAVVRMADYYPVFQGAEDSIELLSQRVNEGYSVVVFPEGTRTADGTMKRFHKGAFYLAEKLNLDMLPVLIHGTGYTMIKGDYLLKDGEITLEILKRIHPGDKEWGTGYAEKVKSISHFFRQEYSRLKSQVEKPGYFKEQLVYNYLYKGPVLEWYMKVKIRLEKNYTVFHDLLPAKGKILDVGCGYGFMAYMLHFSSPQRSITGIDYDENKIATANGCFSKNDHISFLHGDVLNFRFEQYDAIILADMLHYLEPDDQKKVVEKCIASLRPSGMIIIREGNKDMKERHKGTMLTEFFSTKFTGFNKTTGNRLSFLSGELIHDMAREHHLNCRMIDNTKFTSNVIFILTNGQPNKQEHSASFK
ncbi:MAG: 1-acyl-sn-glycerol-3-phosphate acyltransferase [Chitinophagaceae bacterium]